MSDKLNRARGLNSQENGRAWLICGHLWTLASFVAVGVKAKSQSQEFILVSVVSGPKCKHRPHVVRIDNWPIPIILTLIILHIFWRDEAQPMYTRQANPPLWPMATHVDCILKVLHSQNSPTYAEIFSSWSVRNFSAESWIGNL